MLLLDVAMALLDVAIVARWLLCFAIVLLGVTRWLLGGCLLLLWRF